AGKARLEVTVKPFEAMPASTRRGVGAEAGRVAAVRGVDDVRVRYEDL
ncbi:MAG: winged helix DNA-binding domain-containing protein, partial [Euzebyaceae bacterium]|nr:winged helix DNA-binding domain-containing protein [Euzebyaceae bacterium]